MKRPTFLLWCSIKPGFRQKRIVVPVPLPLVEDILQAVASLWSLGSRWLDRQEELRDFKEFGPLIKQFLQQIPQIVATLRQAGPFTLVEISQPADGLEVVIKVV